MKTEALVERIRRLDEQMDRTRKDLAHARRATVAELFELVGAAEAARLLGVKPAAIYNSIYKMADEGR